MRLISYVVVLVFISTQAFAQWQWGKIEQQTKGEFVAMCTDTKGSIYSLGTLYGTAQIGSSVITGTANKSVLIKYDANGNFQWLRQYPTQLPNDVIPVGVASDDSDNVCVTGFFKGTFTAGNHTITAQPNAMNVFTIKYDDLGNVLWAKKSIGSYEERAAGICSDHEGNFIITGYFQSPTVSFGTYTLTHHTGNGSPMSGYQYFITKYGPAGNEVFAVTNPTGAVQPAAISSDQQGNFYLTGSLYMPSVTFGSTQVNSQGCDYFLARFHSDGSVHWAIDGMPVSQNCNVGLVLGTDPAGSMYASGIFSDTVSIGSTTLKSSILQQMAQSNKAIEINLSSNRFILGVSGNRHPLNIYYNAKVPLVICTDDAGVSRDNLAEQYVLLTKVRHFSYAEIKQLVKNGITYSFLPQEIKDKQALELERRFAEFEKLIGSLN